MAQIEVLGKVASFNDDLANWDCDNQDIADILNNLTFEYGMGAQRAMDYAVEQYDAKIITPITPELIPART